MTATHIAATSARCPTAPAPEARASSRGLRGGSPIRAQTRLPVALHSVHDKRSEPASPAAQEPPSAGCRWAPASRGLAWNGMSQVAAGWPPVVARWSRPPLACWPVEPPEPRHSAQPLTRVRTLTRDRRRQSPRPGTGSRPAGLVPAGPAGWSRSSGSTRCRALARKAAHTSSPTAAGPVLANSRHQGDGTDAGSASAHRRRRGQGLSDVGVAVAAARAGPNRIVMREALLNRHDLLLLRGPSVYPAIPGVVLLAMVSAR